MPKLYHPTTYLVPLYAITRRLGAGGMLWRHSGAATAQMSWSSRPRAHLSPFPNQRSCSAVLREILQCLVLFLHGSESLGQGVEFGVLTLCHVKHFILAEAGALADRRQRLRLSLLGSREIPYLMYVFFFAVSPRLARLTLSASASAAATVASSGGVAAAPAVQRTFRLRGAPDARLSPCVLRVVIEMLRWNEMRWLRKFRQFLYSEGR